MALNIRSKEADELATAISLLTGETKTQAVTQALRERLERTQRARSRRSLADELDEIAAHCAALPTLDHRSDEEILGYGPDGMPR